MGQVTGAPADRFLDRLSAIERRLRAIEHGTPLAATYTAPDGAKVEVGVLDTSGTVGIRVYNSAGSVIHSYTST